MIFSNFPARALDFPPGGGGPFFFFMGGGYTLFFFGMLQFF